MGTSSEVDVVCEIRSSREIRPKFPTMFSAACCQFVKSTGKHTLHPTPSIDEQDKIHPYQLVVKSTKRRFIFWDKDVYHPTKFQLTDVLKKDSPLETMATTKAVITKFQSTSKRSIKGMFGSDFIKEFVDGKLGANYSKMIDTQFDQVSKVELDEPDLLSELENRYIDMDHPYIREIRNDEKKVLCVITGVSVLDNGGTLERCIDGVKGSLNLSLLKNVILSGEVELDNERVIGLPPMAIAYNVRELNVNIHSGQLHLVMARGCHGGFVDRLCHDEVDVIPVNKDAFEVGPDQDIDLDLEHPMRIFLPLVQLPVYRREAINKDLLHLLSVPRDLELLSQITDRAEEKQIYRIKVEELEKQLVSTTEVWLRVFTFAGFTVENGELVQPLDASPLLPCIGEFLEAATELDADLLQLITKCGQDTSEKIIFVLQEGIKGNPISDTDMVTRLSSDTNATKLLLELQYRIQDDTIQAPVELPFSIDEVYWILYAIWGQA